MGSAAAAGASTMGPAGATAGILGSESCRGAGALPLLSNRGNILGDAAESVGIRAAVGDEAVTTAAAAARERDCKLSCSMAVRVLAGAA